MFAPQVETVDDGAMEKDPEIGMLRELTERGAAEPRAVGHGGTPARRTGTGMDATRPVAVTAR